jgi:hypothetical protein
MLLPVTFTASTLEKNTRIPSGMTSVTSRLSPLRIVIISSMRVCAATAGRFTSHPPG